jgi:hypothetical protein
MRRPDCLEGDRHHADRTDLSGRYAATAPQNLRHGAAKCRILRITPLAPEETE